MSTAPASFACSQPPGGLVDGDDVGAAQRGQPHEHQADGAGAVHHHGVAQFDAGLGHSVHDGGQRLQRGGVGEVEVVGQLVGVAGDDRGRDDHLLGERAVEEFEVLAEALAVADARPAVPARHGVGGGHAVADGELVDAVADRGDDAGELVAESRWQGGEQLRVPAPVGLQVGAAGGGRPDLDEYLTRCGFGGRDVLQP